MWSGFRIFINLLTYWKNMTPDYNINIIIIYDYNSMNSVLICFIIFIFNCNNIQDKRVIRISWSDLCRSLRVILHTLWFIIFFILLSQHLHSRFIIITYCSVIIIPVHTQTDWLWLLVEQTFVNTYASKSLFCYGSVVSSVCRHNGFWN